jgi:hypothetical protein
MTESLILLPTPRKLALQLDTRGGGGEVVEGRSSTLPPQGYRLVIGGERVEIVCGDDAGIFYGRQTLAQLHRQFGAGPEIPRGEIEDWPDFPVRGVMLDVSRDKVPTMATLLMLVDLFAELKINQLQLYTEHTFAYAKHPDVWRDLSPMTPEEVRQLDDYCRARFIELVPNQNSFGHMARWLKHSRYADLAEAPDGFTFPWGLRHEGGFTLNPLDPRSLELVESLYDELLPCFRSQMLNVGCDETFDLGLGRSREECERRGKERVYLDFILKIYDAVRRRGRTMQFWGDIILHKPELIGELPKDVIALNWGYEADHPFEKETRAFADAGVPFYVCPGTSSWVSISGRTDNAIGNLKSAAEWGLRNGASGYLNTDWGDLGHLQYLPVSYLGFAAGAAYSWCYEANRDLDVSRALDVHVFRDAAGVMGRLMYDFGNIYQVVKNPVANGSRLFWSLMGEERRRMWDPVTREDFDAADVGLDPIVLRLHDVRMDRPDTQLIIDEVRNGAAMLKFACHHGRHRLGADRMSKSRMTYWLNEIVTEHKRLWLARNRPGGLRDSCAQLEARRADYAP